MTGSDSDSDPLGSLDLELESESSTDDSYVEVEESVSSSSDRLVARDPLLPSPIPSCSSEPAAANEEMHDSSSSSEVFSRKQPLRFSNEDLISISSDTSEVIIVDYLSSDNKRHNKTSVFSDDDSDSSSEGVRSKRHEVSLVFEESESSEEIATKRPKISVLSDESPLGDRKEEVEVGASVVSSSTGGYCIPTSTSPLLEEGVNLRGDNQVARADDNVGGGGKGKGPLSSSKRVVSKAVFKRNLISEFSASVNDHGAISARHDGAPLNSATAQDQRGNVTNNHCYTTRHGAPLPKNENDRSSTIRPMLENGGPSAIPHASTALGNGRTIPSRGGSNSAAAASHSVKLENSSGPKPKKRRRQKRRRKGVTMEYSRRGPRTQALARRNRRRKKRRRNRVSMPRPPAAAPRSRARTVATHTPLTSVMRAAVRESYRHDNNLEGLEWARAVLARSVTTPIKTQYFQNFPTPVSGFTERGSSAHEAKPPPQQQQQQEEGAGIEATPTICRNYGFTPSRNQPLRPSDIRAVLSRSKVDCHSASSGSKVNSRSCVASPGSKVNSHASVHSLSSVNTVHPRSKVNSRPLLSNGTMSATSNDESGNLTAEEQRLRERKSAEVKRRTVTRGRRALSQVLITPVKLTPSPRARAGRGAAAGGGRVRGGEGVSVSKGGGGGGGSDLLGEICRGLDMLESSRNTIKRDGTIVPELSTGK